MDTMDIILTGTIVLLVMFGYVKYKDLKHELDDLGGDVWEKAGNEWVTGIDEKVNQLVKKDDCCKK